jgi:hypothetical protein
MVICSPYLLRGHPLDFSILSAASRLFCTSLKSIERSPTEVNMTDNEIMIIDEQSLKNKIYTIRGQQVMLDADLAEIYGYTTKAFN